MTMLGGFGDAESQSAADINQICIPQAKLCKFLVFRSSNYNFVKIFQTVTIPSNMLPSSF